VKNRFNLIFAISCLAFNLAACSKSGSENGSQVPNQDEKVSGDNVYRCQSDNVEKLASVCVGDNRALVLGEDILRWTPQLGSWLSLQFETQYIRQKYQLSSNEIKCLIKNFCQEKLP
jgi:hypothetical protein